MTDMDALDRLIAKEVLRASPPPRPVDDAAIFTVIITTQSPKWRFQSMFSATKFVIAGAIVALFGGYLLSGQPFDQQGGSVPGAATDIEAAAPVEFTAKTKWVDGGATKPAEFSFIETSDPRIDGTMFITVTSETYPGVDFEVEAWRSRIENEGGAWQGPLEFSRLEDGQEVEEPPEAFSEAELSIFVGEGGYEGLIVVAEGTWDVMRLGSDLHGFIIEGELPVALEPWSAE
jgi:hypothetical protein